MKMRLVFILFVVAIAVADAFEGLGRLGMVGRSRRQHLCRPPLSVLRLLRLRIPALPLTAITAIARMAITATAAMAGMAPATAIGDAASTADGTELASALAVVGPVS
jgi:hypothetical protein